MQNNNSIWRPSAVAVANAVLGIVNIAAAFLWWNLIRVEALRPIEDRALSMDQLAFGLNVIAVAATFVAIAFALLGVFGYAEIRESVKLHAERVASQEAKKAVADEVSRILAYAKAPTDSGRQYEPGARLQGATATDGKMETSL